MAENDAVIFMCGGLDRHYHLVSLTGLGEFALFVGRFSVGVDKCMLMIKVRSFGEF